MKKTKSVIGAAALGLATLSASFGSAASGLDAPAMSAERQKAVMSCVERLDRAVRQYDTRNPKESFERYYFYNDSNRNAIKTAVSTGAYDDQLDRLNSLSAFKMAVVSDLVGRPHHVCAQFADVNGSLPDEVEADTQEHMMLQTRRLVDLAAEKTDILKELKNEGDRLIAAGTPPVGADAPVFLFR